MVDFCLIAGLPKHRGVVPALDCRRITGTCAQMAPMNDADQISKAAEGLFVMEDWHNFGPDYDKTLMAWHQNFEKNWDSIKSSYNERFYRMWRYYLLACAGSFRARKNQLWQIVLSKKGIPGGYESIR